MTVETAASNGMKYSTTITDVLLSELAKTLRMRSAADRKIRERIEALEESKEGYKDRAASQIQNLEAKDTLLKKREEEVEELIKKMKDMSTATPEERDMASQMTCEFRKEYRAEVEAELERAGFIGMDISDCFQPMMETDNDKLKDYLDEERERTGTSPFMRLYHFSADEEERNAINKIADLYNEYDHSLMHKTHRVSEQEFAMEESGETRTRVSTISGLRAEEASVLGKLIERRSREADIIELGKQDPDLEEFYRNRKVPEHIIGDYSIEPAGRDTHGEMKYNLTVSEDDRDAAAGMLMETKLMLATPYAAPYLEMYELEKQEMEKINKGIDANKEFTVVDINNASHILRVYKDGYSEISVDAEGKMIKKDYEVQDPSDLKRAARDVMNTMAHPFHIDKKDIKPKDIVVNEEYQERISAFAALETKTDDAYQYSPKNFTRQFKIEITEEGGVKLDAPEHIQPPVIAAEDIERYRKNEKIRQFIAQGLDPQEARDVGDELDQIEFEKYSSYYHPEEEEKEEKKEFAKEDRDSLIDVLAASFAGIAIASRFPEKRKEEEHSLGSGLQQIITGGDRGEEFADPGRDIGD
jgi:hypothetical protein